MPDEAQAASSLGLGYLERAQIAEVVKAQLLEFRLGDLRDEVHDAGMKLKETDLKLERVHKVLIDDGDPNTVVSKVNKILDAEAKRIIADAEMRLLRRQIVSAVVVSILLSVGALLWQVSMLLPP